MGISRRRILLYERVIDSLVQADETLRDDYLVRAEITDTPIYDNTFMSTSINDVLEERGGVTRVYSIFERRVWFTVART